MGVQKEEVGRTERCPEGITGVVKARKVIMLSLTACC